MDICLQSQLIQVQKITKGRTDQLLKRKQLVKVKNKKMNECIIYENILISL